MKKATLLFPHQLFEFHKVLDLDQDVYLIESWLFFKQYNFHKQKLVFHRASMKFYGDYLREKSLNVIYISSEEETSDIRKLIPYLASEGITEIHYINPVDNWLEKRLTASCEEVSINSVVYDSPSFLNTSEMLAPYFRREKKKFFQTTFYKAERKRQFILLDQKEQPIGGKWSYDADNRKKYPAKKIPPPVQFPDTNLYYKEALAYVSERFSKNLGSVNDFVLYPHTFEAAHAWFQQFLQQRFTKFGPYEDAIVAHEGILYHSVLSPLLNSGLLTPKYVIDTTLDFASESDIPLNSVEGFIRQIIGWREFVRGVYVSHGSKERTRNFWNFRRKIPASFYDGTTGIEPVDQTIKKVLQTGYCHHIERLMILGNFMLLCEFDPDDVYVWFMELFIDAYDWVMVPNVYGMSQFADGGLFATKPYISGSNYVRKMSDYKKGEWQAIWDGLFWRFMDKQRDFFLGNPRLGMLVRNFDKMPSEKKEKHLLVGEAFLKQL